MRRVLLVLSAILLVQFQAVSASAATLVARVSVSGQTMTVSQNGVVKYRWPVSTGRKGYGTPKGTWSAKWLSRNHRSRKYNNAPMPFAVFYNGGYAVHATYDTKRLGRPASHGCVRLHPDNAATFFRLARAAGLANTRIVVAR
ncbi:L,D-transpeptidase [Shinella daejeonensis]|uniref:L,D-transpeptidase n=1 Tax=Shinella daejeonensis TaxID=659017 RepID=UPI0020C7AD89|nr:L,D-transpeptidase [Shinella daejeonensis]MCP8893682.1 L,D-transpeptidase [Shinella daejeonensis]